MEINMVNSEIRTNTQPKRMITITLFLLTVFGTAVWLFTPEKLSRGKKDRSQVKKNKQVTRQDATPVNTNVENYLLRDYQIIPACQIEPEPELRNLKSARLKCDQEQALWVQGFDRSTDNPAQLELRFFRPGPEGTLEAQRIWDFRIAGIWDGNTVTEAGGPVHTTAIDGSLWPRQLKYTDYPINYALVWRCPITNNYNLSHAWDTFSGLFMGQIYYIQIQKFPGKELETLRNDDYLWTDMFIKIPKNVPPGHIAVMNVDVSRDIKRQWWLYEDDTRTKVNVKLTDALADRTISVMLADAASGKAPDRIPLDYVDNKANLELKVEKLGGELVAMSKGYDSGYAVCYISKVSQTQVTLPKDADLVVTEKDLVKFKLKIPEKTIERVRGDFAKKPQIDRPWVNAIGLCMKRRNGLIVAGHELPKKSLPDAVTVKFVPGEYYVFYRDGDAGRQKVIGKISLKKTDAGKVVPVELF